MVGTAEAEVKGQEEGGHKGEQGTQDKVRMFHKYFGDFTCEEVQKLLSILLRFCRNNGSSSACSICMCDSYILQILCEGFALYVQGLLYSVISPFLCVDTMFIQSWLDSWHHWRKETSHTLQGSHTPSF